MYTWEIKNYLEKNNYELDTYEDFYKIFKESPQIKIVKLEEILPDKVKYYLLVDDFSGFFWVKNKREND